MNTVVADKVVTRKRKVKPLPSREWLNSRFDIIPEVQGIVWKGGTKEAGSKCKRPDGSKRDVCVGITPVPGEGVKLYPVHLIVWHMLGRDIPDGYELNHKDGDLWNNSVDNLECISINQKNLLSKPREKDSNLPPGVSAERSCYRAYITYNGKMVSLGYYSTVDQAAKARKDAEEKIMNGVDPTPVKIAPAKPKEKPIRMKPSLQMPTVEYLKEALRYDPDTGKFYWRSDRPRHHFNSDRGWNISNSAYGDKEAGQCRYKDGRPTYVIIRIGDHRYYAHRLVWMIHYGVDAGQLQIDHINRDPSDNRIDNLRLATNQENSFNSPARTYKENDAPRGIIKYLDGRFEATLKFNDKMFHLGVYSSAKEAQNARREKAEELGIATFLE